MHWYYDPGYDYGHGLPGAPRAVHGFVLRKPSEIRDDLIASGAVAPDAFRAPAVITPTDALRVHEPELLAALETPAGVARAIEVAEAALLPAAVVKQAIVAPQWRAAGGTYAALRAAVGGDSAANLSGGFHHARCTLAHGFCLLNDIAIALARLRHEGHHRRILLVDLDVHQGDGNATMFAGDRDVYTLSIHEEDIFPWPKMSSDLDIGLRSFTDDADYLRAVDDALAHARRHCEPEIVVYLAGSDAYVDDPLSTLMLSRAGLRERDERVVRFARGLGCPLVLVPAGGYSAASPAITADTFRAAAA